VIRPRRFPHDRRHVRQNICFNWREEESAGAYEICDEAAGQAQIEPVLHALRSFPEVKLKGYRDAPAVFRHIEINLVLSRQQWR